MTAVRHSGDRSLGPMDGTEVGGPGLGRRAPKSSDLIYGILLQCEAPKIAKLVYNPITMVYGTYNYSYWGL